MGLDSTAILPAVGGLPAAPAYRVRCLQVTYRLPACWAHYHRFTAVSCLRIPAHWDATGTCLPFDLPQEQVGCMHRWMPPAVEVPGWDCRRRCGSAVPAAAETVTGGLLRLRYRLPLRTLPACTDCCLEHFHLPFLEFPAIWCHF